MNSRLFIKPEVYQKFKDKGEKIPVCFSFLRAVEILRMASSTNHMSLLIVRDEASR